MATIQKPALRNLQQSLIAQHQKDPQVRVDGKVLDQIVAIVGESGQTSTRSLQEQLRHGDLLPAEKLALAQQGLDATAKADVKALLDDPQMAPLLDAVATNFLKALVGLEQLRELDGMGQAARTDKVGRVPDKSELQAVHTFRKLVNSEKLADYYKAAIGEIDNPGLKQEAWELFSHLPTIKPDTGADELVALGLWSVAPRGIEQAQQTPRYQKGRQVLVKTTVSTDLKDPQSLLAYKEDGVEATTYRARLVGQEGDSFLVAVEGRDQPLRVPRAEVFELNQPHELGKGPGHGFSGVRVDYESPLLKAKLAEAAIRMEQPVGELDHTRKQTEGSSGQLVRFAPGKKSRPMREVQADCLRALHSVIDMKFPNSQNFRDPSRWHGGDAGRLAVRGLGVDYTQLEVFRGLLAPFAEALGVEVRTVFGSLYRGQEDKDNPLRNGMPHVWLQTTYLPSLEQSVCDPCWQQIDHPLDKAYSKWGDRYPANHNWGPTKPRPVRDDDVDL